MSDGKRSPLEKAAATQHPLEVGVDSSDPVDDAAQLARYEITQKLVPQYEYKGYRYSSLRDAVAQARRDIAQSLADQ